MADDQDTYGSGYVILHEDIPSYLLLVVPSLVPRRGNCPSRLLLVILGVGPKRLFRISLIFPSAVALRARGALGLAKVNKQSSSKFQY